MPTESEAEKGVRPANKLAGEVGVGGLMQQQRHSGANSRPGCQPNRGCVAYTQPSVSVLPLLPEGYQQHQQPGCQMLMLVGAHIHSQPAACWQRTIKSHDANRSDLSGGQHRRQPHQKQGQCFAPGRREKAWMCEWKQNLPSCIPTHPTSLPYTHAHLQAVIRC